LVAVVFPVTSGLSAGAVPEPVPALDGCSIGNWATDFAMSSAGYICILPLLSN
jgi:hypothetical protein